MEKEQKWIKVQMEMESPDAKELKTILSHHADYIIDFESNKDVLTSVRNVKFEEPEGTGKKNLPNTYKISVSYSWGDEEDLLGTYSTEDEAYEAICMYAVRETHAYNEERDPDRTCEVYFNEYKRTVNLRYCHDNTWCYYRIIPCNSKD